VTRPATLSLPLGCVVAAALASAACCSSTSTDVLSPTAPSRCQATVQGAPTSFGPGGGSGTVTLGVSRECPWSATSTVSWIEITSSREGQGDATLSYRVLPNGDPVVRRGTLSVAEQRLDLTQQGPPCTFEVAGSASTVGPDGGQLQVDISTHSACTWTASVNASWVTLTPPSGTGPGAIQVLVSANPGSEVRNATIIAGGQALPVTQASRPAPAPGPTPPPPPPTGPAPPAPPNPPGPSPPPGCTFTVAPTDRSFTFLGGTGSFSLNTSSGCTWSASSSASWVAIVSGGSGAGSQDVRYVVLPSTLLTAREAVITVGGMTHRITQAGVVNNNNPVELDGPLSGLSGTCPARRFTVEGRVVTTSSQTDFRGGNCSQLVNGLRVEVEGRQQSDGTIAAESVRLNR
jgi:hypothetical protein